MLTYFCAYFRYHYPLQFLTSFLNNAANDEDIINGTAYAAKIGVHITMPRWGVSKSEYAYDEERRQIAKGLASVKYISNGLPDELYELAHSRKFEKFVDVLQALNETSINSRQLDILIKIDFFAEFGNQRELLRLVEIYNDIFKAGEAKKVAKDKIADTPLEPIVARYAIGTTKQGTAAKSYTLLDIQSILSETEDAIKSVGMSDLDLIVKIQNFKDAMGYMGYVTYREEDRAKLFVESVFPLHRKKDGKQFGYSLVLKSIGSGKESRMSVMNESLENKQPPKAGSIIQCLTWERNGQYFTMRKYRTLFNA